MSRKRKDPTLKDKLAAALRELFEIPYDHAKLMSADQIISLVNFDHNEFWTFGGSDEHWNLTPMLIVGEGGHREKTKVDIGIIRKCDRISKAQEEFQRRLLTPRDERPPKKSRWGSRPFSKRKVKANV